MDKSVLIKDLRSEGFSEKLVEAFSNVKREEFVPDHLIPYSYENIPIPIEDGATISQPSTIALMLSLLDPKQNQRILEIGSGSGYVLALISQIIKTGKVYGVEINKRLAIKSKKLLSNDSNIQIINRSGFFGLKEFAPFDRILISASANEIPFHLLDQLKDTGVIVSPVKNSIFQIKKIDGKIQQKEYSGFTFVELQEEDRV